MTKEQAREKAKEILARLTKEEQQNAALACFSLLQRRSVWQEARSILTYLSFGKEMDTSPLLRQAFQEAKWVAAAKTAKRMLHFHPLQSLDQPFQKGPLGIREPSIEGPLAQPSTLAQPSIILVPGLAFDKNGNRLGRGKGYYDRFIAEFRRQAKKNTMPFLIGYAYEKQVWTEIPIGAQDEKIDALVTESQFRLF